MKARGSVNIIVCRVVILVIHVILSKSVFTLILVDAKLILDENWIKEA